MKLRLLLLFLILAGLSVPAEPKQAACPIQIILPTGWILEISPDGAGRLFRKSDSFISASTQANCFDYANLYRELAHLPEGDSDIEYGFNCAGNMHPRKAPKKSQMIPVMLRTAEQLLSAQQAEAYLEARKKIPLLPKN